MKTARSSAEYETGLDGRSSRGDAPVGTPASSMALAAILRSTKSSIAAKPSLTLSSRPRFVIPKQPTAAAQSETHPPIDTKTNATQETREQETHEQETREQETRKQEQRPTVPVLRRPPAPLSVAAAGAAESSAAAATLVTLLAAGRVGMRATSAFDEPDVGVVSGGSTSLAGVHGDASGDGSGAGGTDVNGGSGECGVDEEIAGDGLDGIRPQPRTLKETPLWQDALEGAGEAGLGDAAKRQALLQSGSLYPDEDEGGRTAFGKSRRQLLPPPSACKYTASRTDTVSNAQAMRSSAAAVISAQSNVRTAAPYASKPKPSIPNVTRRGHQPAGATIPPVKRILCVPAGHGQNTGATAPPAL